LKKEALNQVFTSALEHANFATQLIVRIRKRAARAILYGTFGPGELKSKIGLFLF
jgi:hypothetical protein